MVGESVSRRRSLNTVAVTPFCYSLKIYTKFSADTQTSIEKKAQKKGYAKRPEHRWRRECCPRMKRRRGKNKIDELRQLELFD